MPTPKTATSPTKKTASKKPSQTEQERSLEAEVRRLEGKIFDLCERVKYCDEAIASSRAATAQIAKELETVRKERDANAKASLEVARLNGVLQGLERAGKIETVPPVNDAWRQ